jgi:hypothetical protein
MCQAAIAKPLLAAGLSHKSNKNGRENKLRQNSKRHKILLAWLER